MATSCRMSFHLELSDHLKIHYSDAAAALVGSLGLVPSVNAGDTFVMGEPFVVIAHSHLGYS